MKIKDFLKEHEIYLKVENEIREWVEKTYACLSIEFYPHLELVRTNELINFNEEQVQKITEVVNIKIGDIMEKHAEEIYIAERLTRILKKHPRFNPDVKSIDELKQHPQFLKYLKELIIKPKNVINIADYNTKEA